MRCVWRVIYEAYIFPQLLHSNCRCPVWWNKWFLSLFSHQNFPPQSSQTNLFPSSPKCTLLCNVSFHRVLNFCPQHSQPNLSSALWAYWCSFRLNGLWNSLPQTSQAKDTDGTSSGWATTGITQTSLWLTNRNRPPTKQKAICSYLNKVLTVVAVTQMIPHFILILNNVATGYTAIFTFDFLSRVLIIVPFMGTFLHHQHVGTMRT